MTPIFGPMGPKMVKMALLSHFRPKRDKKWVDPGQNGLKMVKKGHFWTPISKNSRHLLGKTPKNVHFCVQKVTFLAIFDDFP